MASTPRSQNKNHLELRYEIYDHGVIIQKRGKTPLHRAVSELNEFVENKT